MGTVVSLTPQQVDNIQIDEGVIFIDFGLPTEKLLAPTRGGGEFAGTVSIRDIEFDGRAGKTKGAQVIEEVGATLKVTTLDSSLDTITLALPNARISGIGTDTTIKNPKTGKIPDTAYCNNICMFAKTLGGKFKKILIHNPMSETGLTLKAAPKAEGEIALEFNAHETIAELDGDLYEITDVTTLPTISAEDTTGE